VWQRPGLANLMVMGAVGNFVAGVVEVLLAPLVLSASTPGSLASVMAAAGFGGLLGGALATVWRGPTRDVRAMRGWSVIRMFILCVGALHRSQPLLMASAFVFMLLTPLIQTRSETLWQREVDLDVQGRVFALKSQVALLAMPVAYALAGPLADLVFEPTLASGASWTRPLTFLYGTGHGAGMASLLAVVGALGALIVAYGYSRPSIVAFDQPDRQPDRQPDGPPAPVSSAPEPPRSS
jgi:DHA3 family macrolide efflux protein-like MFS transporter